MKTIYFSIPFLICVFCFFSCQNNEKESSILETTESIAINNASQDPIDFYQSVIMYFGQRQDIENDDNSARTLRFENYNPNYFLLDNYSINGMTFTDDGQFNDAISGDQIYTSMETFEAPTTIIDETEFIASEEFLYGNSIPDAPDVEEASTGGGGGSFTFGCKTGCDPNGVNGIGIPCSEVIPWHCCIYFYDCYFTIGTTW